MIADGQQDRGRVVLADRDPEPDLILQHLLRISVATVLDLQGHVVGRTRQVGGGRSPCQACHAVHGGGGQRGGGRQPAEAVNQRIFVQVGDPYVEGQGLVGDRHHVSNKRQPGWFVGGLDRHHKGQLVPARRGGRSAAGQVAVVASLQRQGIIAPLAEAGGQRQATCAVPLIDEVHEVGQRKARQGVDQLEDHRVLLGIVRHQRDLDHLAPGDRHVVDGVNHRRPVRVEHADQHIRGDRQGLARPIAVVRGRDAKHVLARIGKTGCPVEQQGFRIEGRPDGNQVHLVRDRRIAGLQFGQRAVGETVGRQEGRIIWVASQGAEAERLIFLDHEGTQRREDRQAIHVQHREGRHPGRGGQSVGGAELDLVHSRLIEGGRPAEKARRRIEGRPAGQGGSGVGHRVTIRVHPLQLHFDRLPFQYCPIGESIQLRGLVARGDKNGGPGRNRAVRPLGIDNHKLDVLIAAGVLIAGGPGQHPAIRIEDRAGGERIDPRQQQIAVGIQGVQRDFQPLSFATADDRRQRP